MRIILERVEPFEKAFARLRESPLEKAGDEKILIYRDANIRLAKFYASELNPTSLYVLNSKLEFQLNLRIYLRDRYQIDTFDPPGILHLRNEEGKLEAMFPPFVEFYPERLRILPKKGDNAPPKEQTLLTPVMKDGIHRAYDAYRNNEPIFCIVVSGALAEPRPYAYPNAWDEIKVCDKIPPLKKYYRRKDSYTFMRPLTMLRQTDETPVPPQYGRTDEKK